MEDTGVIEADKPIDTPPIDAAAPPATLPVAAPPAADVPPSADKPLDGAAPAPDGVVDEPTADKPGLPDDWRETAAGGDEATLNMLKRFKSLSGVAKALKDAQDTIRSGKVKQVMPDPSDEKAMAEWRKGEGIPPDPAGYKLPETVIKRMVDEDKPILSTFMDFAHKKNARPDVVEIASEWYVEMAEAAQTAQIEKDNTYKTEAEDLLRKDWSHGEYKANTTMAKRWVEAIPGLGENALAIRDPVSGKRLGDLPEFISWAAEQGRDKFGDVAFSTTDSERRHTSRIAEIKQIMNTDINAYYEQGLDKEYSDLLAKEQRRK